MATYAEMQQIFDDIRGDFRYDHELNGCLNCGICTATCPAAHYYDFSPREIVQLLWTENVEQASTTPCRRRSGPAPSAIPAPRAAPSELARRTGDADARGAIKHGMQSAKNVLRPFSRVMLKLITTGNQLSPDMISPSTSPTGARTSKVEAPCASCARPSRCRRCNTTETAWEVNL
jgi:heterodisulfide reductase subunit C1